MLCNNRCVWAAYMLQQQNCTHPIHAKLKSHMYANPQLNNLLTWAFHVPTTKLQVCSNKKFVLLLLQGQYTPMQDWNPMQIFKLKELQIVVLVVKKRLHGRCANNHLCKNEFKCLEKSRLTKLLTYLPSTHLPTHGLPTYLPTIYLAIYLPTYLCRIGTMKSLHGGYIGAYLNWIRRDYLGLHKAYLGNYKNIS